MERRHFLGGALPNRPASCPLSQAVYLHCKGGLRPYVSSFTKVSAPTCAGALDPDALIALNWLLQCSSVATVIVGARDERQILQNLGAVGWNLAPKQVAKLDRASAVPKIYPFWHQTGFAERNPFPTE